MNTAFAPKARSVFESDGTFHAYYTYEPFNHPEACREDHEDGSHTYLRDCMLDFHNQLLGINNDGKRTERIAGNIFAAEQFHGQSFIASAAFLILIFVFISALALFYMVQHKRLKNELSKMRAFEGKVMTDVPGFKTYFSVEEEQQPDQTSTMTPKRIRRSLTNERQQLGTISLRGGVMSFISKLYQPPAYTIPPNLFESQQVEEFVERVCRILSEYIQKELARIEYLNIPVSLARNCRLLGRGRRSSVYESVYEHEKKCAVKIIPGRRELVDKEVSNMRNIGSHSNKINYHASYRINEGTMIVMELAESDLRKYLEIFQEQYECIDSSEICTQITEGVKHLHKSGFTHGDLTPSNVLVVPASYKGAKTAFKLADFSLSCKQGGQSINLDELVSNLNESCRDWYAPEIFRQNSLYFEHFMRADIYTLGCLITHVICKGTLVRPLDFVAYAMQIVQGFASHNRPVSTMEALVLLCKDLVELMTARDPNERPSIECVVKLVELLDPKRRMEFKMIVSDLLEKRKPKPQVRRMNKKTRKQFDRQDRKRIRLQQALDQQSNFTGGITQDSEEASNVVVEVTNGDFATIDEIRAVVQSLKGKFCRGQHWTGPLGPEMKKFLFPDSKSRRHYNTEDPVDLIRLFRNINSHFLQIEELRAEIGDTPEQFEGHFSRMFPMLLPCIYRALQPYKYLRELAPFYHPDEDLKYQLLESQNYFICPPFCEHRVRGYIMRKMLMMSADDVEK